VSVSWGFYIFLEWGKLSILTITLMPFRKRPFPKCRDSTPGDGQTEVCGKDKEFFVNLQKIFQKTIYLRQDRMAGHLTKNTKHSTSVCQVLGEI
jgi:hypothetical protein